MWIKDYKLFLESKSDIDSICKQYGIENYTINDDDTVDVDSNVNLSSKKLTELPLKFGRVTGSFNCDGNKLTSLEGSPKWVGGYFSSSDNNLKTLEGGPEVVIGSYYCSNNQLVNFKGFPEDYEGDLSIGANPILVKLKDITREKRNKFIYWCNEYDAIDDQGNTIPERMEEVYQKIGLKYEN